MEHRDTAHSTTGYGMYITVWVLLLILTAVTITVARMHLGNLSTFTAVFIATVKATLVLLFFMHLKYEPLLIKIILLVSVATLTVIILLTFSDIWFR